MSNPKGAGGGTKGGNGIKGKGRAAGANAAGRMVSVRVKTAKKRSNSSTQWLQRQLNDPYVQAAKREGYRSRAAFKLLELDQKFQILKTGLTAVDLGAAPGGWTQILVARIGTLEGRGKVVGLDILEMEPIPGAILLQQDFMQEEAPELLKQSLGGPVDLVLSDMAAPTTGHKATDHLRIVAMAEHVVAFAYEVLKPGGGLLIKMFQGGTENQLLAEMKQRFAVVKHAKPPASRKESAETYVWCHGYRSIPTEPDR